MNNIKKDEILNKLKEYYKSWEITKSEILSIIKSKPKHSFSDILLYIASFIIFLWISFLIWIYWTDFSAFIQVVVTLWTWIAFFILANILLYKLLYANLWLAIHLISAFLIPFGIFVYTDNFVHSNLINEYLFFWLVFTFMSILYYVNNINIKSNFLLLLSVLFWTIAYSWFITYLNTFLNLDYLNYYFFIFLWLFYYLLYIVLKSSIYYSLSHVLNWFWVILFYMWFFFLMVFWSIIYEFISPFLILAWLFYYYIENRRSVLVISLFFVISYILYLNFEYFSDYIAWPILLILLWILTISLIFILKKRNNFNNMN